MANKRSKTKYPGLNKKLHLMIRQELLDQDYIDKLSDAEKKWLSDFNEEYVAADFRHKGKKLHTRKKQIRDINRANYARRTDAYSVSKVNGMLKRETQLNAAIESKQRVEKDDTENLLNRMIDLETKAKKKLKEEF
jgi:hypothetical protein